MEFKQLREAVGLTMAQAAERAGYGKGTIADLENHGEGSERLKAKLLEVYRSDDAVGSRPRGRADDLMTEQVVMWKSRALMAERRLEALHINLRRVLDASAAAAETAARGRGTTAPKGGGEPSSEQERAKADSLKLASDVVHKRAGGRVP